MSPKYLLPLLLLMVGCTSQKKLSYLNNPPETKDDQFFMVNPPVYKIQARDILYITVRAMTPDGSIENFLGGRSSGTEGTYLQGEAGGYFLGYDVKSDGNIILPVIGSLNVVGKSIDEIRIILQEKFDKEYKNSTVDCKLLTFKFTIMGEVKAPGTYINYNNYLTVLEAIGRAGGIDDNGNRSSILVLRPTIKGTITYRLNLHDKNILSSEGYYLLPNDVVIIEPDKRKIFNLNFSTVSTLVTTVASLITTTLLIINYLGN